MDEGVCVCVCVWWVGVSSGPLASPLSAHTIKPLVVRPCSRHNESLSVATTTVDWEGSRGDGPGHDWLPVCSGDGQRADRK